jgi:hypothetical protein
MANIRKLGTHFVNIVLINSIFFLGKRNKKEHNTHIRKETIGKEISHSIIGKGES